MCLQVVDQLNKVLGEAGATTCDSHIASFCYSLAIDNNLAQLHVSWKDGTSFYIQRVASFLLSDPEHFMRSFTSMWRPFSSGGQGRLGDIRLALDYYIGEARAESTTHLGKRKGRGHG